ncbi:hypothetical protein QBC47DRAFT_20823 [Echria macrotheca]|uniref:Transmembrane protein n=1 Tax=Echria macrotheca TaxID=438768 RepID=A0AAJ0BMK6_9PEZI|nr:hypothetical protein QBC47DRAFT_20823 [Echria macrotheca]
MSKGHRVHQKQWFRVPRLLLLLFFCFFFYFSNCFLTPASPASKRREKRGFVWYSVLPSLLFLSSPLPFWRYDMDSYFWTLGDVGNKRRFPHPFFVLVQHSEKPCRVIRREMARSRWTWKPSPTTSSGTGIRTATTQAGTARTGGPGPGARNPHPGWITMLGRNRFLPFSFYIIPRKEKYHLQYQFFLIGIFFLDLIRPLCDVFITITTVFRTKIDGGVWRVGTDTYVEFYLSKASSRRFRFVFALSLASSHHASTVFGILLACF